MRTILHVDLNSFYASVETLFYPEYRAYPLVVGGDETQRRGIVLAKNELAKACQIKTADTLYMARLKCPSLVVVPPRFSLYMKFSRLVKQIFYRYTDQVESFGIDEAWLDVTGGLHGRTGTVLADELRQVIYEELGITASVGVSWNKIFAKLGSDLKKPNATTLITPENMLDLVWPLPVGDLLFVGRATARKLNDRGIYTIGDLANTSPTYLTGLLGKWGKKLHVYANGQDQSLVENWHHHRPVKSIGNSVTAYRDMFNMNDVCIVLAALTDSVTMRLREADLLAKTISVQMRTKSLFHFSRQIQLPYLSNDSNCFYECAKKIVETNYHWHEPLRSLGVQATALKPVLGSQQSLFEEVNQNNKHLDKTLDDLRNRFGNLSVVRGVALLDRRLAGFDPKKHHVIYPGGCKGDGIDETQGLCEGVGYVS